LSVHEIGEKDGRPYLVMQYVEGAPPGADRRTAVGVIRDTALAVHHAHEHGVIHRDLKLQHPNQPPL